MIQPALPGADLVEQGFRDLERGPESVESLLVSIAAPRLRAIPPLKERLQVNVELASPDQFIPVPPGWEQRSPVIVRIGRVTFQHYDFCAAVNAMFPA